MESSTQDETEKIHLEAPDIHNAAEQIRGAREAYKEYAKIEEQPSTLETTLWYIYDLCSYFIQTVLIPIVFPLIISQILKQPPLQEQEWTKTFKGLSCKTQEMQLDGALTQPLISIQTLNLSALNWTAISWATGIITAGPILAYLSRTLDHSQTQNLVFGGATAIGALSCLPIGFFQTIWLFPIYATAIITASSIGAAFHTRHLALMIRGATNAPLTITHRFAKRKSIGSWLSLNSTAAGSCGAAIIATFTYHMLRRNDKPTALWIVSIFSGFKWFIALAHAFVGNRPSVHPSPVNGTRFSHFLTIFKYPHAVGTLAGILLSSVTSHCLFMAGLLYVFGGLCYKPLFVLFLWLIYFSFPIFSLPVLHPLQQIIKGDAVRMQVLGFLISATTAGIGYFYRQRYWKQQHVFLATVFQGTAAGILHAYGRVLIVDCSPAGKEGAFSVWYAWVRTAGSWAGFVIATSFSDDVRVSLGVSFCCAMGGVLVLVFGNVSNFGGAVAAGHMREEVMEVGSPVRGLDGRSVEWKGSSAAHSPLGEIKEEERNQV